MIIALLIITAFAFGFMLGNWPPAHHERDGGAFLGDE